MSRLTWDNIGERLYETGVKMGVLYPQNNNGQYPLGYAWNGLTAISEKPTGAEATALYANDAKYLNLISAEDFEASIEAYTYPDAFAQCDGSTEIATGVKVSQQTRKAFGLCYRTTVGNDTQNEAYGYKIHIIYGATAAPSERAYSTINDSPEAMTMSWELKTTPVAVSGGKPAAHIEIDSTKIPAAKLTLLENILYGSAEANARLPLPDEIATLVGTNNTYPVAQLLSNVINSNEATTTTSTYSGTLTAATGYTIANVIVTMGGVDVTSTAYTSATGAISIASVTGAISIVATANVTAAG